MPTQTTITITPWGAATFANSLFILVQVSPKTGYEYLYDWKDYTILKDDVSEVRRNREDDMCLIALESGLTHQIPFDPEDPNNPIIVSVGGVEPETNEEMRDLLMAIVEPKYTP